MNEFFQVSTTFEDKSRAEKLAKLVLSKRLAACVQIEGPVQSYYRWESKIDSAEEYVCVIKTVADKVKKVIDCIKAEHHYKTPEVVVTPIVSGSQEYLNWLTEQTTG